MEDEEKIKVKGDDLNNLHIFAYGIGHFLNDLCAACWFFFLSYYLVEIINIGEYNAGYIMLAGQVADAISTPLVGILSDMTSSSWGKRTPWYIGGTILTIISFSLIFINILPGDASKTVRIVYYLIFPALFNCGWASIQVSHMALLPSITLNRKHKERMIRLRTAFTFIAQMITLTLSFVFFCLIRDKIFQYEVLAMSCVGIGLASSIIFIIFCREVSLSYNIPGYLEVMKLSLAVKMSGKSNATSDKDVEGVEISYWLKKANFYAYMAVYMLCRLTINITQSVIPFFMEDILLFEKTERGGTPVEIVITLLISTFGAIFNSLILEKILINRFNNSHKKRFLMLLIACVFVLSGCLPMYFLTSLVRYPIFVLAFIFGIGFSLALSTVSSCINDVVGSKGSKGAFVYGCYSFTEKLSCGITLAFFIPLIKQNASVLKMSMPIFPPLSLILGMIILFASEHRTETNDQEHVLNNNNGHMSIIDDPRFTFVSACYNEMRK